MSCLRGTGRGAIFPPPELIVGSFMAFAQHPVLSHGLPVMGVLGLMGTAALFLAMFTWYIFGGRGKLRIRSFIGKKR